MTTSTTETATAVPQSVYYALDFDGVLVDSAGETAQSGLRGARILWPSASWTHPEDLDALLDRFHSVRPVLYVGWESILMVKLILDPTEGQPSDEQIRSQFHSEYKDRLIKSSGFSEHDFAQAMKEARDTWIVRNNGQDWISAHRFFEGACTAVRNYLQVYGNDRLYVITTKAKIFAEKLLQQQGLYQTANGGTSGGNDNTTIQESHIFGLGSGPKAQVLQDILTQRNGDIGVMVEDNIATLDKIMTSPIHDKVLPVVASWGYNTEEQLQDAKEKGYVMLSDSDSSSIGTILSDAQARKLYQDFLKKGR